MATKLRLPEKVAAGVAETLCAGRQDRPQSVLGTPRRRPE